jgi:hypothetical protein
MMSRDQENEEREEKKMEKKKYLGIVLENV